MVVVCSGAGWTNTFARAFDNLNERSVSAEVYKYRQLNLFRVQQFGIIVGRKMRLFERKRNVFFFFLKYVAFFNGFQNYQKTNSFKSLIFNDEMEVIEYNFSLNLLSHPTRYGPIDIGNCKIELVDLQQSITNKLCMCINKYSINTMFFIDRSWFIYVYIQYIHIFSPANNNNNKNVPCSAHTTITRSPKCSPNLSFYSRTI